MRNIAVLLMFLSTTAIAETPWEHYLQLPTPENAKHVSVISYSQSANAEYGLNDLLTLQNQLLAGDKEAFAMAYRLTNTENVELQEALGSIIGKSIRTNPSFFLEQVAALKLNCSKIAWVLDMPGLEYVDRPAAQEYEIRMRYEALLSVKEKNLSGVRQQCIKSISEAPNKSLKDAP